MRSQVRTGLQVVVGVCGLFLRRSTIAIERTTIAMIPTMPPKITVSPMARGKPKTFCGPTVTLTVEVADSPPRSVTVTVTR